MNYLSAYFPQVEGYIFGSSANNLGFSGCDIDMYIDCGVYPWLEANTEGRDCYSDHICIARCHFNVNI